MCMYSKNLPYSMECSYMAWPERRKPIKIIMIFLGFECKMWDFFYIPSFLLVRYSIEETHWFVLELSCNDEWMRWEKVIIVTNDILGNDIISSLSVYLCWLFGLSCSLIIFLIQNEDTSNPLQSTTLIYLFLYLV